MVHAHLDKIVSRGENVSCDEGFSVFHGEDNIFLGSNISLVDSLLNAGTAAGSITIEDYVFTGHGVKIIARGHPYTRFNRERQEEITEKPIHIRQGAWIGSGSIVLGGVTIGQHAVVAAGSVVTRNVSDYAVVGGNPARVIFRDIRKKDTLLARIQNKIYRVLNRMGL